ncbi:HAMP domain-containing sensor histidine kinase [Lentibacillus sp. CBA3610]|uniref:sensor histidine kinase n=1 Tax=Lentibacillus sp. CBA3610 TaxID=2518176 RepID=UPI0015961BD7|nr:HAMP domain-containing sensor histidine kinase [Lentibacillus sp. CBA3610]QKY68794.1 HAMP domain-containing histidine kinase [Lentibacillus sp. CBA3610]
MFSKLSIKIGSLFFMFILIIEVLLFFILYTNLANDRIDEVMDDLLARGNTHAEVLERNYHDTTLEHVGIMESTSDLAVAVTNPEGRVIVNSNPIDADMQNIITQHSNSTDTGQVIEDQWNDEKYIAAASPILIDGNNRGSVFMFADTNHVKRVVDQLGNQFIAAGLITMTFTVIAILILSRLITQPLINMKHATEQLSKGQHSVELNTARKDELGELADAITKLSDDLTQLKRERHEFLGSISHELRTPLTYIKGYADIIGRQNLPDADVQEYTAIIREETEHLALLIKNLFDLAKIDQNKFVIEQKKVRLSDLIQTVEDRTTPVFAEENITFTVHYPAEDVKFHCDPERLQQALLNLLDNAKNHTYEGGQVVLEAAHTAEAVHISVSDDGEGIPEEDLPYIFDRMYRVEKSRSRESGGSGLGLAIAKEIIESHGGTIHVESERGKGTRVLMTLKRGNKDV